MRSFRRFALLFVLVSLAPGASIAQAPQGAISGDLSGLSNAEIDGRVAFLTERLEDGQRNATFWQEGFTVGWTVGAGLGTAQAVFSSNSKTRANGIVTAVKAAIGVTRLVVWPHPGRLGAEPILAIGGSSRQAKLARLEAGENQLARTKKYASSRTDWLPHVANVGLNLAGGGVLLGVGRTSDALVSAGIGIVFGELLIWSRPARSVQDVEDYRRDFVASVPSTPKVAWRLAPRMGGAAVEINF